MKSHFIRLIEGIQSIHGSERVPLHRFVRWGKESEFLEKVLQEENVTTSGQLVLEAETRIRSQIGVKNCIATTSGTSALHTALHVLGCNSSTEVITQGFTFVATVNAILYTGASPVFVDCDRDCLGISPKSLASFLEQHAEKRSDGSYNKTTGKRIQACVPVHVFGSSCKMDELLDICRDYKIKLVEDAAQAYGASYKDQSLGTFGDAGIFSFNGSKVVTAGMGGAIVTNNDQLAQDSLHLTCTAQTKESGQSSHDQMGFNYRMANLNAGLLCSQLQYLDVILQKKKALADKYDELITKEGSSNIPPIDEAKSTYWLNHLLIDSHIERDRFVAMAQEKGVDCRAGWKLMTELPFCGDYQNDGLVNARHFQERIVLLPSGIEP